MFQDDPSGKQVACIKPNTTMATGGKEAASNNNNNNSTSYCWTKRSAHYKALLVLLNIIQAALETANNEGKLLFLT
jgi:hypothetical protein